MYGDFYSDNTSQPAYQSPTPVKLIDYSPDRNPSAGLFTFDARQDDIIYVLQVRDLGAIVLRAKYVIPEDSVVAKLMISDMSTFTRAEIGYSEKVK